MSVGSTKSVSEPWVMSVRASVCSKGHVENFTGVFRVLKPDLWHLWQDSESHDERRTMDLSSIHRSTFNLWQSLTDNKEHTFRRTCHTSFESHQFSSIGIPESSNDSRLFWSKWFSNWTRNGGLIFFILILGRWHHCVFFEAGISGFEGDEWEIKGCPFTTWRGKFKKWISR